jgi:HEAT repeat protein
MFARARREVTMADMNEYAADGNFKRGRTKPIAIVVGLALVAGAGGLLYTGMKTESTKMSVDDMAKERKAIRRLHKADQLPKWREWAKRLDSPQLRQDAFAELAWVKDMAALPAIIAGLSSDDHRIRGTAAQALFEYSAADAAAAKAPLIKALAEGDDSDKPQIAWALAHLGATEAFESVMVEYRAGHLAKVQMLDQRPAFDPDVLAAMVTIDKLATLADDQSPSVRQLVATVLSRTGEAKWTDKLVKLVQDKDVEIGREAAVGLGKIANEAAMAPLLSALTRADKDSRAKFLEALRDGIGANGLILALKSVSHESFEREKAQTQQLFDMIKEIEDPRGGDLLVQYLSTDPKPHWKTEAGLRLAEVGDLRAVPVLAWRMRQEPLKLYNQVDNPELRRDDDERRISARMLADLAVLYPDHAEEIRKQAEDAVMFWLTDRPQPHANGLRFLAASGAVDQLSKIRKWSDPQGFPEVGAQHFSDDWATAESSLRYLGWMRDAPSWKLLEHQLNRRPATIDATMDSLMQGGIAVLGMTLRAIGVGAADGFAQWGDPKAFPLLTKYIEDPMGNDQSRLEACFALSWVATDEQMKDVVKKVHQFNKPDPKNALVSKCYLETLIHRPVPTAAEGLLDFLKPDVDMEARHQAARAIGFGGVTPAVLAELTKQLDDVNTRTDAALALLVGGTPDVAARAVQAYDDAPPEAIEELKVVYNQTFGYWSDKNYENGDVARWIANAEACRHVNVHGALQDWPSLIMERAIQGIEFDNGPHSITRMQFRVRLMRDARGSDDARRTRAVQILKFMKEKGVLMALRGEPAPLGPLAKEAFFEIMNPKSTAEALPDAPKQVSNDVPPNGKTP